MRIPQLSLRVDNKPGMLIAPCQFLADAGINIVTLSLADRQDFGILRLIVRDWQRAKEVLEAAGFTVVVTEVLAIEVRDQPGGLLELLQIFGRAGLNVEYMYAFAARLGVSAVMIFCFTDVTAAIFALARASINPVSPLNLFDHLDE
jgi:hypothetical protein